MITQWIEQEERVKNTLEFLKKKEDMCADVFKGMLLKTEQICQKVPETKQKKKQEKKGAKDREEI